MTNFFENLKHTLDITIPDKDDLPHGLHPKIDYVLLVLRNSFVIIAVILFLIYIFSHLTTLKAIAYFCGAAAYLFEFLAVTDCFQTKVPHTEMFMIYCFGPLYLLLGLSYIL